MPVIFSCLRIGQLGWVVRAVPAKTPIRPSGAPRIFKEGGENFLKKEYFHCQIFGLFY